MTSGSSTSPSAAAHKRTSSLTSAAAHRHQHHPVRSPTDRRSSPLKSHSPSPERTRKRANSSRTLNGHQNSSKPANGHGDSEAETDILSDEEPSKTKVKKRVVKDEPKDDFESSSPALKTKSESARSHTVSRATSVNGDAADKRERKPNGAEGRENGLAKAILKDKPRLSTDLSKNSSRAQSADASTSPNEHNDRSRQAHSAEPRKRKFSDAQKPSKLEPPRQKPRLEDVTKAAKPQKRANSPPTPGTPGLRSSHRRSASTQSNLPSAGLGSARPRRDISSSSMPPTKEWATSDMSSDEAASFPVNIPKLAPPPRSGRAAYRAMTSPARTAPTGKRADKFGSTPLARACEKGNLAGVKQAYEEAPGEIDQADNGGFAPLQKAALEGHTEIVQFLLEHGCRRDVRSKDEQDTPLIDAVENGHVDVVKLLLDHGVNPYHQNKSGKRAIDAIDDEEDYASDLRDMLQKSMRDYVGSESDSDDEDQHPRTISAEDKNRADLLYLEPNRANLIAYSEKGDAVAVDHFLSSVKPDNAAAVAAARAGHKTVLELLLASAGDTLEIDPDPTKYEKTPLLAAIGRGSSKHLKIIRLLLDQDNFNPTRKTKDGLTYYEYAAKERGPKWEAERDMLKEYYEAYMSKRKVQKRKRQESGDKTDRKTSAKEPSSSPQAVIKEKKMIKKPPVSSPTTKEAKRRNRAVVESSDEDSDEEVRVRKKPMRERRASMVSKSSNNEPSSPAISRQSSGSKIVKREDIKPSKESKENSKPPSRKPSSEKRHSTDSKMDDRSDQPPAKASTPESVREARKAEEEARLAKAAEKAAEAERKRREAEEAAAKEAARKVEEERLQKEKEEQERKEKEERERREQAEREEHERRVAALPTALRLAVQKGKDRPLIFRSANKEHPEELGISMQFLPIQTAPLRNIDPTCDDTRRDELWMPAFQIVGLLGLPSELRLAEFPDWERRPFTNEQRDFFLEDYDLCKLAQQFRWPQPGEAGYDHGLITRQLRETREAFVNMEPLQWVRYADFEEALRRPEYSHLEKLRMRTATCRIKEEPDSAIDIGFLWSDEDSVPEVESVALGEEKPKSPKEGT